MLNGQQLNSPLYRLGTFTGWNGTGSSLALADAGFFYCRSEHKVKCYSCGVELPEIASGSCPLLQHRQRNPECPHLRSVSGDRQVLGSGSAVEFERERSRMMPENPHQPIALTTAPTDVPATSRIMTIISDVERQLTCYFPGLNNYISRLETFQSSQWSAINCPAKSHDLAVAALFYTGQADKVQCVYCKGKLFNWCVGDQPLKEHIKHFPRCAFVLKIEDEGLDILLTSAGSMLLHTYDGIQMGILLNHLEEKGYRRLDLQKALDYSLNILKLKPEDIKEDFLVEVVAQVVPNFCIVTRSDITPVTVPSVTSTTDVNNGASHQSVPSSNSVGYKQNSTIKSQLHNRLEQVRRENQQLVTQKACRICKKKEASVLFLPCRHLVICEDCCNTNSHNLTCIVCKANVLGSIKTYLS